MSRPLDSPITVASGETYWMAALVQYDGEGGQQDPDFDGVAYAGFGNADDPTDAGSNPAGYYVGILGDGSEMDLVLRHRTGTNSGVDDVLLDGIGLGDTHLVILKAEVNASGFNEVVTVWVDPSDVSSEAALGTPVSGLTADASLFGTTSFDRLTLYGGDLEFGLVRFDELALGASLADVVTAAQIVPEPQTWSLILLGLLGLTWLGHRRVRRRSVR